MVDFSVQRRDAAFQAEVVSSAALALHENRRLYRERRLGDIQEIQQTIEATEARWRERLQRIDQWRGALTTHQDEQKQLADFVRRVAWYQKAETIAPVLVEHTRRQLARLQPLQTDLHQQLGAWLATLQRRRQELEMVKERERKRGRAFLMSRARKRPELLFLETQQLAEDQLAADLAQRRDALQRLRRRLQKASSALEQHAGPMAFEIHKSRLQSTLQGVDREIEAFRRDVLADVLIFEEGRSVFRWIQQAVYSWKTLEEAYRPLPLWKRLFRFS